MLFSVAVVSDKDYANLIKQIIIKKEMLATLWLICG